MSTMPAIDLAACRVTANIFSRVNRCGGMINVYGGAGGLFQRNSKSSADSIKCSAPTEPPCDDPQPVECVAFKRRKHTAPSSGLYILSSKRSANVIDGSSSTSIWTNSKYHIECFDGGGNIFLWNVGMCVSQWFHWINRKSNNPVSLQNLSSVASQGRFDGITLAGVGVCVAVFVGYFNLLLLISFCDKQWVSARYVLVECTVKSTKHKHRIKKMNRKIGNLGLWVENSIKMPNIRKWK